ncbi:unnamed protein product [Closterium sp. Naga37s-1]|nr:unnamed protein product [Closterium sp. Naga37s-1]
MAPPDGAPVTNAPGAGVHGKKPLYARPELVTPKTLFNGTTTTLGAKEINVLSARTSDLRIDDKPEANKEAINVKPASMSGASSLSVALDKGKAKVLEPEDDGGYLSDDPDECQDHVVLNEIAAQAGFAITLLVPFAWSNEIPHIISTVKHLLLLWGKHLSENVKETTSCQQLTATFLSKKHFGRIEVVFLLEADAKFMQSREIEHYTVNEKKLTFGWLHPENKEYLRERAAHPEAIEVLLKGVPAVISPAMIRKNLVKALLLKRGHTAFLDGSAFHRVLDPVSDPALTLLFIWLQQRPSMLISVPPFPRAAASLKLSLAMKILMLDPAIDFTSTRSVREEWLCAQEDCAKAHVTSFEKAVEHVHSVRHGTGLLKAGAATRMSKGKQSLANVRKEFGM